MRRNSKWEVYEYKTLRNKVNGINKKEKAAFFQAISEDFDLKSQLKLTITDKYTITISELKYNLPKLKNKPAWMIWLLHDVAPIWRNQQRHYLKSIRDGSFPETWKKASLTPILKVGPPTTTISLTCMLPKEIERFIVCYTRELSDPITDSCSVL